jgi:8-oxo-dGTP pyrophosphatase MutT (NUDIX family)
MSDDNRENHHRNDIYGDLDNKEISPTIPASTVVILRDGNSETEVLMLHRTSKVHFGGMWVFPGGRIDPDDYPPDQNLNVAARNAAVRETREEANIDMDSEDFVQFAHWTPPPTTPKRYATSFYACAARKGHESIEVDGEEIQDHVWISPRTALERHAKGEIDLAPPTWVTLYHLDRHQPTRAALEHFAASPPQVYETHVGKRSDGVRVAMWTGDAGYVDTNADAEGARHRLIMAKGGFSFEHPDGIY